MSLIDLIQGDCLKEMRSIPAGSVDMILADVPYGTTSCKWDSVIPLEPMWEQVERVVKPSGAIVMTASQPFTSALIMSNPSLFRYCWVWDKKVPSGMSYARFQPMRQHEDVVVFYRERATYNPQMVKRDTPIKGGGMGKSDSAFTHDYRPLKKTYTHKNPTTIIGPILKVRQGAIHPTQKPVELMEYLIRTYTEEGELVLDFAAGSFTTAIACINLQRSFIGIELDPEHFARGEQRVREHQGEIEELPEARLS